MAEQKNKKIPDLTAPKEKENSNLEADRENEAKDEIIENNNAELEKKQENRKKALERIGVFIVVVAIVGVIFGIRWFTTGRWFQETERRRSRQ